MPNRAVYHVVPRDEGWAIEKEGASRATSVHETKAEALTRAKELAKAASLGQVKIHGQDGRIQTEHTYGQDPSPPPG